MIIRNTDNNEFLEDGVTPNPNFGAVTETEVEDPIIPPAVTISVTDFKKLFTFTEKVGIVQSTDPGVRVFWDELNTAAAVTLTDADTINGVEYLTTLTPPLITSQRATIILTPKSA